MATLAETFTLACRNHQAGNLIQAEQMYRHILQVDPSHGGALNGVGTILAQKGRSADAAACFQRALKMYPENVDLRSNLGLMLSRQGQYDSAVAEFQQILRLKPDHVEAHFNLGNALRNQGQLLEASRYYQQALHLQPNHVETRNNLANLLAAMGRLDEAVLAFQQIVRLQPGFAEAWNNLGNVLTRLERFDEAIRCYGQATALKGNFAEAYLGLGNALHRQHKLAEAIRAFRHALQLRPNYVEALTNLGSALAEQNQPKEAIACYKEALRVNPQHAAAHYNLGNALALQDKLDDAIARYRQALKINPKFAAASANLGNLLQERGQFNDALACCDEALRADAANAEIHYNRALLWLRAGNWAQGWPEYEWRWRTTDFPRYTCRQPRWDGTPLAGRTLLLLPEQGLGDTIQFVRFAPVVQRGGGRVIVECQPQMLPLLAGVPGIDQVIPHGAPTPPFDIHAPLLSVPGILQTAVETVPAAVPYVHADQKLTKHWRQEIAPIAGFKIGIAWQGTLKFRGDRRRSIPLANFSRLAQVRGVQLISLQKGAGSCQLSAISYQPKEGMEQLAVHDLGAGLDEASGAFMDSAAVMQHLDLVISSDTAIPHLAGALGVPVWLALTVACDWRWLLERHDSPWYPTMRLFRQAKDGCWDDVFERIAKELDRMLTQRGV